MRRSVVTSVVASLMALAGFVAVFVAVEASPAWARHTAYYGDAAAMTGGAGMALYRGGGSAWYNPAGLVGNRRNQVDLSASVFVLRFQDSAALLETRAPGQVHKADLDYVSIDMIPSALVYKRRLSKKVHAAVAMFVTDQDSFEMHDVFEITGSAGGMLSRYYQRTTVSSKRQTYHFGGMLSWAVTPRFRLGWGLFGVYSRFSYEFRDLTASHLEDQATSELQDPWMYAFDVGVQSTFWALRLTMGMQWEFAKDWFFGMMVRTPTLKLYDESRLDVLLTLADASAAPGDLAGVFLKLDTEEPAFGLNTPLEMVAGFAYRNKKFFVGFEGEVHLPFHHFQEYIKEIDPQWNLRLGGRMFLSQTMALGVGAFTERSLRKELLFVGDHHLDYYGAVIGLKWRKAYSVRGRVRDDALVFSTTIAVRYANGTGTLRGYVNDLVSDDTGEVDRIYYVHEFAFYLGSSLYF